MYKRQPGTTWANATKGGATACFTLAVKTDGTLWGWGLNSQGQLGVNSRTEYSSPVQIPGTTWSTSQHHLSASNYNMAAIKTDGTLWTWGRNENGDLGLNQAHDAHVSSPTQVPGTTWRSIHQGDQTVIATKTDGSMWVWSSNSYGRLGLNSTVKYSSPVQLGSDTTWSNAHNNGSNTTIAVKTDGTLWTWGDNERGQLGQNTPETSRVSSPVQVPGTTWSTDPINLAATKYNNGHALAIKTDGTLWTWGDNTYGTVGDNTIVDKSSPTQIPGTTWYEVAAPFSASFALKP